MPSFWLYVLLILLFSVTLKWLPISGYEKAVNWVLPIGGGVLGSLAGTIRLTKTEVLDVFREKYVLTAYAKGLPHKTVMVKHVMRNALILITVLVFMSIPWLITQDYAVVQGCILIIAVLTVVFNTLSDVVVGMLDPRIRITMNGGAGA